MPRIISMVVKLDDNTYRTIKLHKIRSIYTAESYICNGNVQPGEDDVAGQPTKDPVFDDGGSEKTFSNDDGGENGQPPNCYFIDGVWICT